MNRELAFRLLTAIMEWDDVTGARELKHVGWLASYKYDGYADYIAGARFIESFGRWLQQFSVSHRQTAYNFVMRRLLYVTTAEVERLIDGLFPNIVYYDILDDTSLRMKIEPHLVLAHARAKSAFEEAIRKTLFIGLSDGARMEVFRRANVGRIVNDQVLMTTEVDDSKWDSVHRELTGKLGPSARFDRIYLIDDFTASGTTFCRKKADDSWDGKLKKFYDVVSRQFEKGISADAAIVVHHYIGTEKARRKMKEMENARRSQGQWFAGSVTFTFGHLLREENILAQATDAEFLSLCEAYYDPAIENEHGKAAGEDDLRFGYAKSFLPLVLQHNTPNNTVAIVWAESPETIGPHKMIPLFRRRQRHS